MRRPEPRKATETEGEKEREREREREGGRVKGIKGKFAGSGAGRMMREPEGNYVR